MTIAKVLKSVADWLDRRFPEKMTVADVEARFESRFKVAQTMQLELAKRLDIVSEELNVANVTIAGRANALSIVQESVLKLRDELAALKAVLRLAQGSRQLPPGTPPPQSMDGSNPWKR